MATVVLNGAAGDHDDTPLLEAMNQLLRVAGRRFPFYREPSTGQLHATNVAAANRDGDAGIVVAISGGSTINTAASAPLGTDITLGVVPPGTFNHFARVHGIPLDAPSAVGALLNGQARPVQVGRVNERAFFVDASLGMYPHLRPPPPPAAAARPSGDRCLGSTAAWPSGRARACRAPP